MPSLPPGFSLRPSRVGSDEDARAIYDLVTAISWPYNLQSVRQWNQFEGIFLIVEDATGKVVATSSVVQQGNTASVGATITLSEYRGKGFAYTLVSTCIEHCSKNLKGVESLILAASALGAPIYRRLGFREFSDAARLVCQLGPVDCQKQDSVHENIEAVIIKQALPDTLWEDLIGLANDSVGRDRRQVMEMHLRSDGKGNGSDSETIDPLLIVTQRNEASKLTGALCARPHKDSLWSIGPIIAQNVQQGKDLLDSGLIHLRRHLPATTQVAVTVDIENPFTKELYEYARSQHGFEQQVTNRLMERVLSSREDAIGPARKLAQEFSNGQKAGPHPLALLDYGFL